MNTRSQTIYEQKAIYAVNIDFNGASEEWKSNKINIGNGSYKYGCAKKGKCNNICIAKCLPEENYCRTHFKMFKDGKF